MHESFDKDNANKLQTLVRMGQRIVRRTYFETTKERSGAYQVKSRVTEVYPTYGVNVYLEVIK